MTTDKGLNPMDVLKPINLSSKELDENQPLTTVEMGKLWATYIGNSMSGQLLSYFLRHCENEYVRTLLENGIALSKDFLQRVEVIFKKNNFPSPAGFSKDDVNLDAPRLFEDEFYVHYLKYAAKAGLSLYAIALPLVMREDIREFFVYVNQCTTVLLGQINSVLIDKKYSVKPPIIPTPEKVDFINKQSFLTGWFGEVRPLHALEIVHLYDNIENNATSKALLLGFYQTVKDEKLKALFKRGIEMTDKTLKQLSEKLHKENLLTPSYIDHLVTTSPQPPFSDKLMLFHKVDMFSMKVRSFGNAMAVNGRRDIASLYGRLIIDVGLFVDDATNILIDHGWMESPPKAFDRR
ncbi:DUF3231 family protein [Bacillus sp. 31A1R]|uniref:DUF3231 family protein n=1 Tax=Robertmurraya mangrovi TaxID=3098077 RepID=A0ABU5IYK0_9BACI|nr:DUF3231 family protein [Bacillus sp. 31A1R]MDZ5472249.1 DUF3231 family protein [Bacillus sp. 31A1R]